MAEIAVALWGATSNTTLVLPGRVPRLAMEAGVSDYWRKYVRLSGEVIGD
jgi:transketolase